MIRDDQISDFSLRGAGVTQDCLKFVKSDEWQEVGTSRTCSKYSSSLILDRGVTVKKDVKSTSLLDRLLWATEVGSRLSTIAG